MSRIEKLKEYLMETPTDSFLQHALALEYIKEGKDEAARDLFESVLSREPSYVGSYYHLARLYERHSLTEKAISVYERGMEECKKVNDRHALNELRMAYDDLVN